MSIINAGNTTTTAYIVTGDTSGNLTFQSVGSNVVTMNASSGIIFNDGSSINSHAAPNVTVYTSGSGTYTTPTGAKWLQVEMCAGGAGGWGGGGSQGTSPVAGSNTTFGTSLLSCTGGGIAASYNANGGDGGSGTIGSGASGVAFSGGRGAATQYLYSGAQSIVWDAGLGGSNPFGGAGTAGAAATANTGAGGAGGGYGGSSGKNVGASGGAGGYIKAIVSPLSSTYSYSVGAGGAGGGAGSGGNAGYAGAAGIIIITAYF